MSIELPKLREAFEAWASDEGANPKAVERAGDRYRLGVTSVYWLAWQAAWQEAARLAMEAAARECEDQDEPAWYGYENPTTFDDGKRACAAAIRALLDKGGSNG